jgi:4-amino-4-deoxy-L-arabinose transferase-like glycosyltransferase
VLLSSFLRLYLLDTRPAGLTWDEAALGYNAYSLLRTGKDEHGQLLPIIFRSFDDYKPGIYIYLTTVPTSLLGLNEFATRLPSAVIGSLLPLLLYIFARQFRSEKESLFISFVSAINPWMIHFSRGGWEANVALFFSLLAVTLILRKKLTIGMAFLGLTLLTYHGAKMFTPLIIFIVLISKITNLSYWKKLLIPSLIFLLLALPIIAGLPSQSGRLKVFSVFSYVRPESVVNQIQSQEEGPREINSFLFHSEFLDQFRGIIQRYLNYFSPKFHFFTGDWSNARHSTPYQGNFLLPELLSVLIGIYIVARQNSKLTNFLFLWLCLAPIPAALSRDIISSVRALPMAIPITILSGIGLAKLSSNVIKTISILAVLLIFLGLFLDLYFVHAARFNSSDWLYPYKPAIQILSTIYSTANQVIISQKLGQPYIFILYYMQVSPHDYQNRSQIVADSQGDVSQVVSYDKFIFRPIFYPSDRGLINTVLIGDIYELPDQDIKTTTNLESVWTISNPDGAPGLSVVKLR